MADQFALALHRRIARSHRRSSGRARRVRRRAAAGQCLGAGLGFDPARRAEGRIAGGGSTFRQLRAGDSRLPPEIRLWAGDLGGWQQARRRLRQGRRQEGHRQFRAGGLRVGKNHPDIWRVKLVVKLPALEACEAALDGVVEVSSWFLDDPEADETDENTDWCLEGFARVPPDRASLDAALAVAAA